MSGVSGDEPPPLEEMFEVDSGTDSESGADVPDLDDVPAAREAAAAAASSDQGNGEADDDGKARDVVPVDGVPVERHA